MTKKKKKGLTDYWFPVSPSAWDADTQHISAEEDGVYWRLVRHYMKTRLPLQESPGALARIAGVSLEKWTAISVTILAFFLPPENGRIKHKKCDEILQEQLEISRKHKKRAKTAAHARWSRNGDNYVLCLEDANSMPEAMLKHATGQDMTGQERKRQEGNPSPDSQKKEPPLPPGNHGPRRELPGRVLKTEGNGGGSKQAPFSLRRWLDSNPGPEEEILRELLRLCPGWDRNELVRIYDNSAEKRGGSPKFPKAAFLAWVRKFYAGKVP